MAAAALPVLLEHGVREFVVTSTGNSTTAMARLLRDCPELTMHAFAGREFQSRCGITPAANVQLHVVDGDFVEAERVAKRFAQDAGLPLEGGFYNPARRLGLATAFLEVWAESPIPPTHYFQAISSGMGLVGVGELAVALPDRAGQRALPKLIAVQQDTCAPIVAAHSEDATSIEQKHVVSSPVGPAKAILRGDPTGSYPHVRRWIKQSDGDAVAVSASQIRSAAAELRSYGIDPSAEGAAALAAALKFAHDGRFTKDACVMVNVTGGAQSEDMRG